MAQPLFPFQPRAGATNPPNAQASIAVTTAVQQITLPAVPAEGATMRIVVDGAANIAWCFGADAGLTLGNGVHMLGNTVEVFSLPPRVAQLSVIGAATGSTLRVHVGDGQ